MNLNEFVEKFADQFEETEKELISAETDFKSLDEWSSLVALTIIAMVDEEYDVPLKGADIRDSVTIKDLYDRIAKQK
jgi:acyl carrier protein